MPSSYVGGAELDEAPEDKFSLQVLSAMHDDASYLLQRYDSFRQHLDHEGVDKFVESYLERLNAFLEEIEETADEHHPDNQLFPESLEGEEAEDAYGEKVLLLRRVKFMQEDDDEQEEEQEEGLCPLQRHEREKVREAVKFLKALSEDMPVEDQHLMDAHHYGKALAAIEGRERRSLSNSTLANSEGGSELRQGAKYRDLSGTDMTVGERIAAVPKVAAGFASGGPMGAITATGEAMNEANKPDEEEGGEKRLHPARRAAGVGAKFFKALSSLKSPSSFGIQHRAACGQQAQALSSVLGRENASPVGGSKSLAAKIAQNKALASKVNQQILQALAALR